LGANPPTIMPREVEQTQSFEQQIAHKIHSNLVLKKYQPPDKSAAASPPTERSTAATTAPSLRVRVASELAKADIDLSLPSELVNNDVILKGKKHKMQILTEYEATYGAEFPNPIITKKKGKHSCEQDIVHHTCMLPSIKKYYQVIELTLHNFITTVMKEQKASFTSTDLQNLSSINSVFSKLIPKTIGWLKLDFSSLREPQYNYESQTAIPSSRVDMASAAMIHFGLDPGKLVRWLGGEYTGARRGVNRTLTEARAHVSAEDFNHMKRILMDGSPSELTFDKPLANKSLMIKQGN